MDISRPELAAKRKRRRLFVIGTALALAGAAAFYVARLEPAVPTVDSNTIWLDTVEQGELLRQVRIAETQAKDVVIGQPATIVQGNVGWVDPSVVNGTVTVDGHLTSELPNGARPDLCIDGDGFRHLDCGDSVCARNAR